MPVKRPCAARARGTRWDVFCRVVDNYGDAGFCWRLVRQLVREHGLQVRLWIDDLSALQALQPGAAAGTVHDGVRIEVWHATDPRLATPRAEEVADVVIGALGCALPEGYRDAMGTRRPVWVDVEHLSAEGWVRTHHGLPSPKSDGLVEHFFFPGFDASTGGLLRETDLLARRDAFDDAARSAFLASIGVSARPGEPIASLFCYPDAPAVALLDALAARGEGWRVLIPAGVAPAAAGHPLAVPAPFVSQADYDRLLWSSALNFVRGEESFVRALWAQRPMVWQAYRQAEGAHLPKVSAFIDGWCDEASPGPAAAAALTDMTLAWNAAPETLAADPGRLPAALDRLLPALPALREAAARWARNAASRRDLAALLVEFVVGKL